jgi:hypothetical protein
MAMRYHRENLRCGGAADKNNIAAPACTSLRTFIAAVPRLLRLEL